MSTGPVDVDNPGTVNPANEVPGTGLPTQVPTPSQTPASNSGPVTEVESEPVAGTGLPQNVNQ
jgi:hypothetical protein